jgi:hypothetical protein
MHQLMWRSDVPGQQRLIDDVRVMSACLSTSDILLRRGER